MWFRELLGAAPWLAVLSYHLYPLGAGNGTAHDVASKVLRANPRAAPALALALALALAQVLALSPGPSPDQVLRADFLDKLKPIAAGVAAAHTSLASAGTSVWVPELGGAYNSGRPKVTDSF